MIDEKKTIQRLKGITVFFFIQPLVHFINLRSYDPISIGILSTIGITSIIVGFGLKNKKEWGRIMGIILSVIEGILGIASFIWFPFYFKEIMQGNDLIWSLLLVECITFLYVVAYFFIAWWLHTKEVKEYFAKQPPTNTEQNIERG